MSPTGIYRRIDRLGRIVLPMELRRALGIAEGDELAILQDGEQIVLRKVEQACTFCGSVDGLRPHRSKLVCQACATEMAAGCTTGVATTCATEVAAGVDQSRVATS